jgi:hypothetical protein
VGLLKTERRIGRLDAWLRSSAAARMGLGLLLVAMAGFLLRGPAR